MSSFPENELPIFVEYLPASVQASIDRLRAELARIALRVPPTTADPFAPAAVPRPEDAPDVVPDDAEQRLALRVFDAAQTRTLPEADALATTTGLTSVNIDAATLAAAMHPQPAPFIQVVSVQVAVAD